MPRPGFPLFVDQVFTLYNAASAEPDMRTVTRQCEAVISQLRHHQPVDDDEQINIETALELFEELLERAKTRLKLGR